MNRRTGLHGGLIAVAALTLAALACSGLGAEPTATAFLKATQQLAPTAKPTQPPPTKAPTQPRPTQAPTAVPQDTSAPEAPFTLSAEAFVHSSGAFSIVLPEGWTVEEADNSVWSDGPDSIASVEISFTNVGVELTAEELDVYIQANESNFFATYDNYEQTSVETQADGSVGVLKTLSTGVDQTVFTYYQLEGTVIFESTFWVETDLYDVYVDALVEVANSLQTDPDAAAAASPYAITYEFTGPNDLFAFNVPYGWTYEYAEETDAVVDTFTAPDGASFIESIAYDDGTEVSRSLAGAFALELLKQYYQVDDIKVTGDEVQSDGSERLDWESASLGIYGESFFETRGTTFLLLTWVVAEDYHDIYVPVWSQLLDSYTVP